MRDVRNRLGDLSLLRSVEMTECLSHVVHPRLSSRAHVRDLMRLPETQAGISITLSTRLEHHHPIHKQLFPEQLRVGIVAAEYPVARQQQLIRKTKYGRIGIIR